MPDCTWAAGLLGAGRSQVRMSTLSIVGACGAHDWGTVFLRFPMKLLTAFLPRTFRLLAGLVVVSAFTALAGAYPSGGPYGPQACDYPLPKVSGRIYFVSPEGRAGASGATLAEPTSLASAIDRVVTGDAIVMRGGVYRTGDLEVNQGILIQAYGREHPVINGSLVAKDWIRQKNGLWRTKWPHLFPGKPADWWRRGSVGRLTPPYRFNMDTVFVDGQPLHSVGWEGELDSHSFAIDYDSGTVYIDVDPTKHVVEITAHDGGLIRTIKPCHGKVSDGRGLRIRGVSFTQFAYRALEIEGHEPEGKADPSTYGKDVVGSLLENVSITKCSRVGAYLRGDDLVVRNCLVSDTTTEGLYVLASSNCLIERNIVRRNNVDDMQGYFPCAIKIFNQTHNVVCRDNLIIDQRHSNGIWYDVGNVDAVVVDNWFEGAMTGFFFEISKGAICAGNVFVDCDEGVKVLNSCRVQVYQNTFVNSPATFERTERSAVGDHFGWHPSTGPDVDQRVGHVFVGNLMVTRPPFEDAILRIRQSPVVNARLRDQQMKRVDGNLYVREGAPLKAAFEWGPAEGENVSIPYASLSALRAAHPEFEQHGQWLELESGCFLRSWELKDYRPLAGLMPEAMTHHPADFLPKQALSLLGLATSDGLCPGAYPVAR